MTTNTSVYMHTDCRDVSLWWCTTSSSNGWILFYGWRNQVSPNYSEKIVNACGVEILGVFMDIAGRRLSIRATETDTNEGVLVFFFGLVVLLISHYFCVSHRIFFLPQLVGCLIWAIQSQAPGAAPSKDGSSFNQLLGIKGAAQETVSLPQLFCNCNFLSIIWCRFVDCVTTVIESV